MFLRLVSYCSPNELPQDGLQQQKRLLTVLESRSLKSASLGQSQLLAGPCSSEGSRRESVTCLLLLVAAGIPWLVATSTSAFMVTLPSLPLLVFGSTYASLIRTVVIAFRMHPDHLAQSP